MTIDGVVELNTCIDICDVVDVSWSGACKLLVPVNVDGLVDVTCGVLFSSDYVGYGEFLFDDAI